MQVGVLLSGGIDSLYSLLLLKEAGYKVMGIHGLFFDFPQEKKQLDHLRTLAKQMDFSLQILNLKKEFETKVIQPFIQSFKQGLTPNPCSLCNPSIKFGLLLEKARALGCTKLASGHYVNLQEKGLSPLSRGKDRTKDQSYFLALVPRKNFNYLIFPLGRLEKKQVYAEIKKRELLILTAQESNEICFVPEDYRQFLTSRNISLGEPGPIKLLDGTLLGTHKGLLNYTIGQRRGLGIAYKVPLYVLDKDKDSNTLFVGPKEELQAQGVIASKFNFLCPLEKWPQEIWVQIRYRQKPKRTRFLKQEGSYFYFEFLEPEERPSPGQTLVVYFQEEVLGGGIIQGGF